MLTFFSLSLPRTLSHWDTAITLDLISHKREHPSHVPCHSHNSTVGKWPIKVSNLIHIPHMPVTDKRFINTFLPRPNRNGSLSDVSLDAPLSRPYPMPWLTHRLRCYFPLERTYRVILPLFCRDVKNDSLHGSLSCFRLPQLNKTLQEGIFKPCKIHVLQQRDKRHSLDSLDKENNSVVSPSYGWEQHKQGIVFLFLSPAKCSPRWTHS